MSADQKELLGILGGMGAEAGAMLYQRLVRRTGVETDQEHIPTVLYSATTIPDRTEAILGTGEACASALVDGVRFLERSGADRIIIACITSHYYIREMREAVSCEIVSAIEQTVRLIREQRPAARRIGLLATTGTIASRLFQTALERANLEAVLPSPDEQEEWVMEAIYGRQGVKSGYEEPGRTLMKRAAERLEQAGVDALIAGCTEIPLVLRAMDCHVPLFDPLDALIERVIVSSGRPLRMTTPSYDPT